jgi:hypothetical protein
MNSDMTITFVFEDEKDFDTVLKKIKTKGELTWNNDTVVSKLKHRGTKVTVKKSKTNYLKPLIRL